MADEKPYAPTYRDELALTRHFLAVLEQKLAGRDAVRRTNVHPLDWCHLGVLGPAKVAHAPVELDAASLEAEASTEAPAAGAVLNVPAAGNSVSHSPIANPNAAPVTVSTATAGSGGGADAKASQDEPRVVADKGDDREGTRRPPSAIGFEILVQPDPSGFIELTVDASFCVFTKHLPTWREQTTVLDTGASAGAPLAEVVQRWPLEVKAVPFRIPSNARTACSDNGVVQGVLDRALHGAFDKLDAERLWPGT